MPATYSRRSDLSVEERRRLTRAANPETGKLTVQEWNRITKVYAKHDGRILPSALELGWPLARTRRVFNRGYPSMGFPPIRNLMAKDAYSATEIRAQRNVLEGQLPQSITVNSEEELAQKATVISATEASRVAMLVKREEERQRAREDAVKARAEEAMLISINRRNALALNGVTAQVLKGAVALSAQIQRELEAEAMSSTLSLHQKLGLVKSAASIARFNSEATAMAVKSERLVLGQPIDAPGEGEGGGDLNEAVAWIQRSVKALERAKERGLLTPGDKKAAK